KRAPSGPKTSIKTIPHPPSVPSGGKEAWEQLLIELKKGRPNVGSYLEQGNLLRMDEKEIRLGFSEEISFLMPLIQKGENMKWLASFFENWFQREVKLVLVTLPEAKPASHPTSDIRKAEDAPRRGTAAESHPLIQEALKVLGGKVIGTKKGLNDTTLK
ncbi:MAG: hypothetical protein ACE5J1_03580, partial [Nitrospiria bacterium]